MEVRFSDESIIDCPEGVEVVPIAPGTAVLVPRSVHPEDRRGWAKGYAQALRNFRVRVTEPGIAASPEHIEVAREWLKKYADDPKNLAVILAWRDHYRSLARKADEEVKILRRLAECVGAFRNLDELRKLTRLRSTKEYSQMCHAFMDWRTHVLEEQG